MTVPPKPRPAALALCAAGIVAAVLAVYAGGLRGAFLFDDLDAVAGNASIRHLGSAWFPPPGTTVGGRPVLNLSFALSHALSAGEPWGYHAVNVAIHAAAALLLLGIVRRTLVTPAARSRPPAEALALGAAAALLWALHPLQVESVGYIAQRAESLMGLLYLATLYAFIRYGEGGPGARIWAAASAISCLLGMATKEVMATAPLLVLLYDRTFVAGTFRAAWRARRAYYTALAATWVPLGVLAASSGGRGGTAGFGSGVPWWAYALTQLTAVVHYLFLAVWPHPLIGDYGRVLASNPIEVAACGAVVLGLIAGTILLHHHRPALGFVSAWFLVILAPSSSIVPVATEIIAEHRMYLPLAAVVVLGVLALRTVAGWRGTFAAVVVVGAAGLALLTARRVRAFAGPEAFWADVARKVPGNAGAWNNLGVLRLDAGEAAAAVPDFQRALAAVPDYATAHFNLGRAFLALGRPEEALAQLRVAGRFLPSDPAVRLALGHALSAVRRPYDAADEFRAAARLDPASAAAWFDLGAVMVQVGRLPEAADAYGRAVALSPGYSDGHLDYGNVLAQLGRVAEAAAQYEADLRIEPNAADVHNNLGGLLAEAGRLPEAEAQFREALRLNPAYAEARENLERVRAMERGAGR
jgi:tetratricopeptide (TPR) repeat protein